MPKKENDGVRQPIISTGTTAPGFKANQVHNKTVAMPKIGDSIIGDDDHENER